MDERDLLPASILSVANFNVYPQYYRIEDVTLLKDFCAASTKRLLMQWLLHKSTCKTYHHTANKLRY